LPTKLSVNFRALRRIIGNAEYGIYGFLMGVTGKTIT